MRPQTFNYSIKIGIRWGCWHSRAFYEPAINVWTKFNSKKQPIYISLSPIFCFKCHFTPNRLLSAAQNLHLKLKPLWMMVSLKSTRKLKYFSSQTFYVKERRKNDKSLGQIKIVWWRQEAYKWLWHQKWVFFFFLLSRVFVHKCRLRFFLCLNP